VSVRVVADRRMEEMLTDALAHTVLLAYLISETVAGRGLGRRPFHVRQKPQLGSILRRGRGVGAECVVCLGRQFVAGSLRPSEGGWGWH
jgi:hypothetical protein